MKQTILDILDQGQFDGSWKQLKKIAKRDKSGWGSTNYGSFWQLTLDRCKPTGEELYFWPRTGRILHCRYDCSRPARQSAVKWSKARALLARQRRWRTYTFGHFGRVSLPELFLHRPKYALEEIVYGEKAVGFDTYELAELFDKISAIRIPTRFSEGARIITSYSLNHGEFLGFEITEEPVWKSRMNRIVVSRHIDLHDAAANCYEEAEFSTPIPSLMAVLTGDPSTVWDQQQCEAFFNNNRNFLAPVEPFDCELAVDSGMRVLGSSQKRPGAA